jgi:hypothetical protein
MGHVGPGANCLLAMGTTAFRQLGGGADHLLAMGVTATFRWWQLAT